MLPTCLAACVDFHFYFLPTFLVMSLTNLMFPFYLLCELASSLLTPWDMCHLVAVGTSGSGGSGYYLWPGPGESSHVSQVSMDFLFCTPQPAPAAAVKPTCCRQWLRNIWETFSFFSLPLSELRTQIPHGPRLIPIYSTCIEWNTVTIGFIFAIFYGLSIFFYLTALFLSFLVPRRIDIFIISLFPARLEDKHFCYSLSANFIKCSKERFDFIQVQRWLVLWPSSLILDQDIRTSSFHILLSWHTSCCCCCCIL